MWREGIERKGTGRPADAHHSKHRHHLEEDLSHEADQAAGAGEGPEEVERLEAQEEGGERGELGGEVGVHKGLEAAYARGNKEAVEHEVVEGPEAPSELLEVLLVQQYCLVDLKSDMQKRCDEHKPRRSVGMGRHVRAMFIGMQCADAAVDVARVVVRPHSVRGAPRNALPDNSTEQRNKAEELCHEVPPAVGVPLPLHNGTAEGRVEEQWVMAVVSHMQEAALQPPEV
mmetsp:Transcript_347/g.1059  ORF Transcript_347/g.1059 Transcript_347/m.1059 type:complete len:229 (-) Transcript_347:320-1006(-)